MTGLDILIGGVCLGGWLAVRTADGLRDTRAFIRHLLRHRRDRVWLRIVGAPYTGPRKRAEEKATAGCRR